MNKRKENVSNDKKRLKNEKKIYIFYEGDATNLALELEKYIGNPPFENVSFIINDLSIYDDIFALRKIRKDCPVFNIESTRRNEEETYQYITDFGNISTSGVKDEMMDISKKKEHVHSSISGVKKYPNLVKLTFGIGIEIVRNLRMNRKKSFHFTSQLATHNIFGDVKKIDIENVELVAKMIKKEYERRIENENFRKDPNRARGFMGY